MLSNSRLLSALWLSLPEPLQQLFAKLTLMDYALLGLGLGLCLVIFSLGLLLRFHQAKTRLLQDVRQSASPMVFSQPDSMLDEYRQALKALQIDSGEWVGPLEPSLPFAGISKGLLARSYRHAFLVLRQVCLCTAYLQALTGLAVLYTEQYRLRPQSTVVTPAVVLDSIHKLAQELHAPLMALRQLDEPVAWRSNEDVPDVVRQFDAGTFWQDALRTEMVLLPVRKESV
ncbi:MAG: hypothetical protein OEU26_08625 [Candidatus Tectomicrobia bacterium]|nr:hypothetical protein [Candidatus Tectomicrobia bacterium]